ncbi:MAG: hypothetical protein ACI8TX_001518 [Hyphomicrobiaceae bacterium]|jgi:hypothetical protein
MAARNLVVVESSAKAKTQARYRGRDYVVKASVKGFALEDVDGMAAGNPAPQAWENAS